jgi:hypothetical protein
MDVVASIKEKGLADTNNNKVEKQRAGTEAEDVGAASRTCTILYYESIYQSP